MRRKTYGSYKTDVCPYCGSGTFSKNAIGLPVCKEHSTTTESPSYKCICGDWVDVLVGKYGVYARCMRCGNQNIRRILEINELSPSAVSQKPVQTNSTCKKPSSSVSPYDYPLILD